MMRLETIFSQHSIFYTRAVDTNFLQENDFCKEWIDFLQMFLSNGSIYINHVLSRYNLQNDNRIWHNFITIYLKRKVYFPDSLLNIPNSRVI